MITFFGKISLVTFEVTFEFKVTFEVCSDSSRLLHPRIFPSVNVFPKMLNDTQNLLP